MSEDIDDIVKDFVVDSYENLERIDRELVSLEKQPDALEIITRIFRSIHTIKGVCGFLSFSKLREVCHAGESLLGCLRDSRLALNGDIADALLAMVDGIREILSCIEKTRTEGDKNYADLIGRLNAQYEKAGPPPAVPVARGRSKLLDLLELDKVPKEPQESPAPEAPLTDDAPSVAVVTPLVPLHTTAAVSSLWEKGIRVDIDLLDRLMTLVGELVLARNQILQYTGQSANGVFTAASQRLDAITTELQEGVMKTRMQPIGTIWSRFPRLVRDVAAACGKEVHLEMSGMDTDLDKTLIEAIKDPLTHLVRNSVDHGIEAPDLRVAAGKKREGRLTLGAFHEGGFVNIEIADDGAGINFDKVKNKAIQMGLIQAEAAAQLSYKEIVSLIFLPGFSTADHVTEISGRGVGMDVVKTNIERIGGTIDIDTSPNEGTKMNVKVPLTLAIIPALMVVCGYERFAIPQSSLLELVRLDGQDATDAIESINGTPVYRLRDHLLPLVHLREQLELEPLQGLRETINIVVLQSAGKQFGLIVDAVRDTEEIVVKPLAKQLQGLGVYAGATILGDGSVALILEVLGLAQRSHVLAKSEERVVKKPDIEFLPGVGGLQSVLLFNTPVGSQMAIPLAKVARLEAFSRDALEHVGGRDVVQYRDEIMPLIHLADVLPEYSARDDSGNISDLLHVVVYSQRGRSVGLVIGHILDIVQAPTIMQTAGTRSGVEGSAVVGGKVTEMLRVEDIVRSVDATFFEALNA